MQTKNLNQSQKTPNNPAGRGWMRRLVLRLFQSPPRWEPVEKGSATIHTQRYKIEQVELQGTYTKERNQYGEERYWVTEPDGTRYLKREDQVTPQNVQGLAQRAQDSESQTDDFPLSYEPHC